MSQLFEDTYPLSVQGAFRTNLAAVFGSTLAVTGAVTLSGSLIGVYEPLNDFQNQLTAAQYAVSHTIFVNDNVSGTYKVVALSAVFGTASSSGTLNVEVATGTQALASGTNQMSSTVSLAGTANTVVNGTITTQTTISAGARVNLIFAGTVTSLANCAVNVMIQKIS